MFLLTSSIQSLCSQEASTYSDNHKVILQAQQSMGYLKGVWEVSGEGRVRIGLGHLRQPGRKVKGSGW